MIYLTGIESASVTDLLNATRLSSIPYAGGMLTCQFQTNLATASNQFTVTIQLPGGEVPVDTQVIPCGQPVEEVLGGVLNNQYLTEFAFSAGVGSHFTIALTETGAAIVTWRIVLSP